MEFKELINRRISMRSYESAIPHDDLAEILKEAQRAPSWKNMQAYKCYAVESPEFLEEFRQAVLPPFNLKNSTNASLVVTTYIKDVTGFIDGKPVDDIGNGWAMYDLGIHDAFLVLAASNAGYDTLIMAMRDEKKIRELLSIPENEVIMSVIAVGKRAKDPNLRPRKEFDEVNKFF